MHHLEVVTSVCVNSTAPLELSIASAVVSSILLLVTIPTNLFVCLAILIDPNKELQTQFNCFTFNLALADLLVGCITEVVAVYAHVSETLSTEHTKEVHQLVLRLFHIPYFISAMASVLSIATLSLERYFAVTSPFGYRQYFTVSSCVVISVVIWLVSLIFGLMNLLADYILESFIFVNSGVLLTTLIVCFASFKIRHSLQQMSANLARLGAQHQGENTNGAVTGGKLTKTFLLIIGALMCCYLPACVLIYYMNLCQNCDCDLVQWFRDISFWLILFNSAINPFIYAVRSNSFRKAITDILHCRCIKRKKKTIVFRYVKRSNRNLTAITNRTYGSVYSTDSGSDALLSDNTEHVQLLFR